MTRVAGNRINARISAAVALAAVYVVSTPGVAQAASYDLYGPSTYGGYAQADGFVDFVTKYKFNLEVNITDLCPPDGKGANIQVDLLATDGTLSRPNRSWADTNGCDPEYELNYNDTVASVKKINFVKVYLCTTESGNPCWTVTDISSAKYNPLI